MLLSLGALLLLAACTGGGNDSSEGGSTPSAEETQASTDATTPAETAEPTDVSGDVSDGEIDPCSLLSREEVKAAVGNPVEEGALNFGDCDWDSDPKDTSVSLSFLVVPDVTMCTQTRDEGSEDIPGLGVEAWWNFSEAADLIAGGDVIACPDGWLVQLIVTGGVGVPADETALRAAGEELMAKVLDRI